MKRIIAIILLLLLVLGLFGCNESTSTKVAQEENQNQEQDENEGTEEQEEIDEGEQQESEVSEEQEEDDVQDKEGTEDCDANAVQGEVEEKCDIESADKKVTLDYEENENEDNSSKETQEMNFEKNFYDTYVLRHNADFSVELAKGVYWVPANELGSPLYTHNEILELVKTRDPEMIQSKINTLYDAIQYFVISGFRGKSVDNYDLVENGVEWEHHKTGKEALLTNYGDCSGYAALFNYLLQDDYDEVGFISYNQANGSGHVFNYIKHDESYYLIDMTMLEWATTEAGKFGNAVTKGTQGNVHRVKDLKNYVEFYTEIINSEAVIFETYTNDRTMPIGLKPNGESVTYYFPTHININIISNKADSSVKIVYAEPPKNIPTWDVNNLEPLFNRDIKAEIEIVPIIQFLEYYQYNTLNCDIYFEAKNEVMTEILNVKLEYYDNNNELIHVKSISQQELDTHYPNTYIIYDREGVRLGTWDNPLETRKMVITVEGEDLNNHIINESLEVDLTEMFNTANDDYNRSVDNISIYDTETLRYHADFKKSVYPGVMWTPINILGQPNLTKEDIIELGNDPLVLQEKIDNLYEVILYIQASNFKDAQANIRIREGDINWEHHTPGELSIIKNEGNCATISNLLNFLLKDDYDEVGFIAYSQSDGNGHVFNYIKHNDKYYLIDLTHYRNDFMNTAIEDGSYDSYLKTDFIAGNLHEVSNVSDYIKYCNNYFNNPPELFSMYEAQNVLPIDSVEEDNIVRIVYPITYKENINIVYDKSDDNIWYDFEVPPSKYPEEWEPYNTKYD